MTLIDLYTIALTVSTAGAVGLISYLIYSTKLENKQKELMRVKTQLSKAQLLNHFNSTNV
jgi:NAD(P)H-dependent flavin oxidoreductase YrpB (nitropropane dioxygenase family)